MPSPLSHIDQAGFHFGCCYRHAVKGCAALFRSWLREFFLWLTIGALLILLSGCSLISGAHRARVTANGILAGAQADAPKDNATPATVASSGEETRIPIPDGSSLTETTTAAQPATATTPAAPAVTVRELHFSAESAIVQKAQRVQTSTGTIDTAVALRKVEAAEVRWLLWAAIGCGIGGLVVKSMLPAWPAISNGLLAGAVLAFIAWKFSAVPPWLFAVAIGIAAALALGYKRAEWDKDGDGIPDLLEKKSPPSVP